MASALTMICLGLVRTCLNLVFGTGSCPAGVPFACLRVCPDGASNVPTLTCLHYSGGSIDRHSQLVGPRVLIEGLQTLLQSPKKALISTS